MKPVKTAIVIPARYGSTRFPGKPLAKIGNHTMLELVVAVAIKAAEDYDDVAIMVATEDKRIADFCEKIEIKCVMTSANAPSGSDRVLEALQKTKMTPDFVINLQGDAPFTPPELITKIIVESRRSPELEVITPIHRLSWSELDALRNSKLKTPLSGTTVIIDKDGYALWFSKNILPVIRDEKNMRVHDKKSPVYQHIGLYGFALDVLEEFCKLPQSHYEKLEGLEQLRLLENGIKIKTIETKNGAAIHAGIDSPEDLQRAQAQIVA